MSKSNTNKANESLGGRFYFCSAIWFILILFGWFSIATRWWIYNFPYDFRMLFSGIELEYWKNFGYFVGTLGVGPIAIYLASVRTKVATIQVQTDKEKLETEQSKGRNDREKMINENFTKSVELLGNKSSAVRQGAVFSLQRLSGEKFLYPAIIRIITSFIRTRTYTEENIEENNNQHSGSKIDIESALLVIKERKSKESDSYEEKQLQLENNQDREGFLFDMSQSFIEYTDLTYADLRGFNLSDCTFNGCDFSEADFERAVFAGTDFGDSDLTNANFKGAIISGNNPAIPRNRVCDLSNTRGLTQEQIDSAITNEFTLVPVGINLPVNNPV